MHAQPFRSYKLLRLPPRIGRIAAGAPLEAIEDDERGELPAFVSAPGRYALRVGDDSMLEAGIFHGDYVIVQSQQRAADGDFVIALIDGEQFALTRIRHRGSDSIELVDEAAGSGSRLLDADRVRIQGRVVGLLRRYR